MISTSHGASTLNASGNHTEANHHAMNAMSPELAREQAEERRWQLEWDRRNTED